jgi:hypothetical protein
LKAAIVVQNPELHALLDGPLHPGTGKQMFSIGATFCLNSFLLSSILHQKVEQIVVEDHTFTRTSQRSRVQIPPPQPTSPDREPLKSGFSCLGCENEVVSPIFTLDRAMYSRKVDRRVSEITRAKKA